MKKLFTLIVMICFAVAVFNAAGCSGGKEQPRTAYEIYASYDDGIVTGNVNLDYYNSTDNEICDLKFNLYGNAFREGAARTPVSAAYETRAYYSGKSYGSMEIKNVENCAGWTVNGEDENILTVNLSAPVYPGGRVQVGISYVLTLAKINHRTGITADCVNLGNFYPVLCAYSQEGFIECPYYSIGDPFVSECADYKVTLDAPESFIAAASGQIVSETCAEGRRKTEYSLSCARDFAMVLSEKFTVASQEVCGVKVNYYYVDDATAEKSLAAACESLEYFNNTFGEYVYPTLSVVQTGFCYGGMEYPALTMIAAGQTEESNVYTIIHENAHQWWYAMVGSNQLTCPWQDEGLAEYSTLMFLENSPKYGYTRAGIVGAATRSYRAFFSVFEQLNGKADTTMSRNLSAFTGDYEYTNITYNKALIMFDTLRTSIGDEKFVKCLKGYYSGCFGTIAPPEKLIAEFLKSGVDVEGVFDSFIGGKILI